MSNPVAIHTGANWKNVNNWHWIEKDCTSWAHDRIRSLLLSVSLDGDDDSGFSITKINSIEGDVSVNQRKGRVKQLFDLEISFEYKTADGTTGTGFISDFTADYGDENGNDLNVRLNPSLAEYKEKVLRAVGSVVKAFKEDLFEVHGKPLLVEASGSNDQLNNQSTTKEFSKDHNEHERKDYSNDCTNNLTINTSVVEDEVEFPCPSDQLYLMLTDSNRIRAWTRSPANLPQIILPQADFTLFDGNIHCKFLALKAAAPSSIDMEWKLKHWPRASSVSITISDNSAAARSGCVLKMKQTGVPAGEAETIKNNWHNYYWNPIKRAFGVML